MKTFLIAAVAVAVSGAAFAKDLKGTVMTDSEMDKIMAGAATPTLMRGSTRQAVSLTGTVRSISGRCKTSAHRARAIEREVGLHQPFSFG